jgi:hypothetical protein
VADYERELLFLYIEQSEVRERLGEAFVRIEWQNEVHARIAAILLEAPATCATAELLSLLTAREPEASSILSAARLSEFGDMPPQRLAGRLMYSLREGQLNRAIRAGKARLRQMPASSPDYDSLYQETVALQRELSELQKRTHLS